MLDIFKEFNMKCTKAKLLYDEAGKSKCAGFAEFSSSQEAAEAVKQANNLNVEGGKRLNVQLARNK
jgi:RNA recognition motif-containing protein